MIITIDGPAGSGKSTVAEEVSKKLNFIHFNSGTLYRAVCCYFLDLGLDAKNIKFETKIKKFKLSVDYKDGKQIVLVNGKDYSAHFRDNNVSVLSPIISVNKTVRDTIDDCQRKFGKTHNLVVDGRDIGSHVFPNAEFKFYLDCSVDERARRRFKEEKTKGDKISLKEIKQQIIERDEIDKNKTYAPLVVPKGAIVVDSTHLSIEQTTNLIISHIKI